MGKDKEKEGRLQGNKDPNLAFFTECAYLQRVFHINVVLKKTGPECWWWNLFVNHHGQSGERQLWFAKLLLPSTALTAFIPLFFQWSSVKTESERDHLLWDHRLCWAGRNTCFETAFFSGFGWWFLFPLPHQMDSWIFYPLFPELSHHACLNFLSLDLIFINFHLLYHSHIPGGVSSSLCFTQARNYFRNILLALSHKELNITLKGNLKSFNFKILWHSVYFSQSSWVKKFVERMVALG